jgi:exosome complex exonuclease RRP6
VEIEDDHSGQQQQQQPDDSRMQVEIPYVAASQRPTKQVKDEERDTIVVVGQAKQKRKRIKSQPHQHDAGSSNEPAADDDAVPSLALPTQKEEAEPFDFSAVPNILDDNPDLQDGSRKRKRQKKQNKSQPFPFLVFPSLRLSKC